MVPICTGLVLSLDWVDAVGGTTVELNCFAVVPTPLIVSVPADTPPRVMAAVAAVVLAVTMAYPNELFIWEQFTALRVAVPCAAVSGMSTLPATPSRLELQVGGHLRGRGRRADRGRRPPAGS